MRKTATARTDKLEDIPNIGKSIASDLRSLGILNRQQLAVRDPLETYLALSDSICKRHDPCVLYTLLAARHYLKSGESMPWWEFTAHGKKLLVVHPKHMGTSKNPHFIPTAALRQWGKQASRVADARKKFLAYIYPICGAAKFFPRLAFGRTLNF